MLNKVVQRYSNVLTIYMYNKTTQFFHINFFYYQKASINRNVQQKHVYHKSYTIVSEELKPFIKNSQFLQT